MLSRILIKEIGQSDTSASLQRSTADICTLLSFFHTIKLTMVYWRHMSTETLALVMPSCLMLISRHKNQWWLIIKDVMCHSQDNQFTRRAHELNPKHGFGYCTFKIATSPTGHSVNVGLCLLRSLECLPSMYINRFAYWWGICVT